MEMSELHYPILRRTKIRPTNRYQHFSKREVFSHSLAERQGRKHMTRALPAVTRIKIGYIIGTIEGGGCSPNQQSVLGSKVLDFVLQLQKLFVAFKYGKQFMSS